MENRREIRLAIALGLLFGAATISLAQTYTPPPPPLTTLPPCALGKNGKPLKNQKNCDPTIYPSERVETKKKSPDQPASASPSDRIPPAQQFPFPGENPPPAKPADTPAAQAFPYPGSDSVEHKPEDAQVQHDPAAEKKAADTPAGKAFPFPGGATPDMPPDPDSPAPAKQPEGGPQSSSSSSSSSSTPDGSAPDASAPSDSADAPGPKGQYDDDEASAPKLKDKGRKKEPPPQTDTERVDEDLSVAKYYSQSGNKMGAYLRAKDAVKIQPEYPEGHFALGDAARKLNKKEEAIAEFTTYLKLSPDGEHAKAAEKALDDLH